MTAKPVTGAGSKDKWIKKFLAHLASERGASQYTQRNYGRTLAEFERWRLAERPQAADWASLGVTISGDT